MSSTRGCDRSTCKAYIWELVQQEPQICHKKPEILTWQLTQMKLKPRTDSYAGRMPTFGQQFATFALSDSTRF